MEAFNIVTEIILILAALYIALIILDGIYDSIYGIRIRILARKQRKTA